MLITGNTGCHARIVNTQGRRIVSLSNRDESGKSHMLGEIEELDTEVLLAELGAVSSPATENQAKEPNPRQLPRKPHSHPPLAALAATPSPPSILKSSVASSPRLKLSMQSLMLP